MARTFASASSQYMATATTPVTAAPLTLSCWFKPANVTADMGLLSIQDTGVNQRFVLAFLGATAGDPCRFRGNAFSALSPTGLVSQGVWAHAAGVAVSTASRTCYVNGSGGTTDTNSVTPTGLDAIEIGSIGGTGRSSYADADICEAALWNVALTQNELTALSQGVLPLRIRPLSLVWYAPVWGFQSPEIDLTSGARSMTLTNAPAQANHAPVDVFSSRLWGSIPMIEVAAAAAQLPRRILVPETRIHPAWRE